MGNLVVNCFLAVIPLLKKKRYVNLHKSLKTFENKLFKYKIIKLKNYLYLWHTCKKKNTASSCYQLQNGGTCAFV